MFDYYDIKKYLQSGSLTYNLKMFPRQVYICKIFKQNQANSY